MPSLKDLVEKGDVNLSVDYLSKEDKERIAANSEPFTITAINFQPKARFGPAWNISLMVNGEQRTFTVSDSAGRSGYMHDLQECLESGSITDCYLKKVPTKQGNAAYVLTDEPSPSDELPF